MKKFLYIFMIFTIVLTFTCSNIIVAASIPRIGVGSPSSSTVEVGGTVRYNVNIYNNATNVTLKPSDIRITGVTANISVEGSGNSQRTIVLSNIQGSVGAVGYISYIAGGVATNEKGGSKEVRGNSTSFTITAKVNNNPAPQPDPGNNGNNNNNNGNQTLPPNVNSNEQPNNNNSTPEPQPEKPEEKDEKAPTMEIGGLSKTSIEVGDDISFEIKYSDDKEMGEITLNKNNITLYGFTADIKISGEGNTRKVTLSNVQGDLGGLKYIKVAKETAKDKAENTVQSEGKTEMFRIIDKETKNKPSDWIQNPNTGRKKL